MPKPASTPLEELHHASRTRSRPSPQSSPRACATCRGRARAPRHREPALGLGRAHDLLLQAKWSSADLGTVVRSAIEAFDNPAESKFSITGPDIRMASGAVIAVAMTLNELCTNTTKFGALSVPEGRVDLAWTLDQSTQRMHLTWTEKNGPIVQPPARRSFGTRLIETLGKQLRGDVHLTYASTGFSYTFEAPIAALSTPAT